MPFVFRFPPVLFLFLGSQIYFPLRAVAWTRRRIHSRTGQWTAIGAGLAVYVAYFVLNVFWAVERPEPTRMTRWDAVVVAPFLWWIFSSTLAFLVVVLIWIGRGIAGAVRLALRGLSAGSRSDPSRASSSRRQFLEGAATAAVAAPFVAGAYGLLYGRLNLQTTHQPIYLRNLPQAFDGFRIAQLSDVHIGPFMGEDEIRKYVRIANALKPDMIVLTGDFLTFDPSPKQAVVAALSGLRAPFGVFGCLGNHDSWAQSEDALTELFGQAGVRILRQQNLLIRNSGERFNLIGIDFANSRHMSAGSGHMSADRLEGMEALMEKDAVNLLLSHNPDTFNRAAELGIDFSLAGHTHGGQLALEFISPEIAPSRIVTPYVAGWFQRPGGQLYVNRGIGTIAAPMRVGAPPELTVFQLVRGEPTPQNAVTRPAGIRESRG
ncbi:MAG TPA: metallophosphoesterase [Bryobacteraceae bacterium]|nr:metallophosphoesterase [Bryobacteraceae bacterium]